MSTLPSPGCAVKSVHCGKLRVSRAFLRAFFLIVFGFTLAPVSGQTTITIGTGGAQDMQLHFNDLNVAPPPAGSTIILNVYSDQDFAAQTPDPAPRTGFLLGVPAFNGSTFTLGGMGTQIKITRDGDSPGRLFGVNYADTIKVDNFAFLDSNYNQSASAYVYGSVAFQEFVDFELTNSLIQGNLIYQSDQGAGALGVGGGGLYLGARDASGTSATLRNTSIVGNSAMQDGIGAGPLGQYSANGGGAYLTNLQRVTIAGNADDREQYKIDSNRVVSVQGAVAAGGGMTILNEHARNVLVDVSDYTFSGNQAQGTFENSDSAARGGGLALVNSNDDVVIKSNLENILFSGNTAETLSSGPVANTRGQAQGGGLVALGNTETRIANSTFSDNVATIRSTRDDLDQARGGGLAFLNENETNPNVKAVVALANVTVTGNTAQALADNGAVRGMGVGGGMAVVGNAETSVVSSAFRNNSATTASATGAAYGGGLYVVNEFAGLSTTLDVTGTLFEGNRAEAAGTANAAGGAVYFSSENTNDSMTIVDSSFVDNYAKNDSRAGDTTSTAAGGAIWTDRRLTIVADAGDVLFQGNYHQNGDVKTPNSISSGADVLYVAAAGRTICDLDAVKIIGSVTKEGAGTLAFLNGSGLEQHRMGEFNLNAGIFISEINGVESSFRAIEKAGVSTGTVDVADGTTWVVLQSGMTRDDLDRDVKIGDGGWKSDDALANAQAALDRGNEQLLVKLTAGVSTNDGEASIVASLQPQANMSDIYASSLLMHRWNTIYSATNSRIDDGYRSHGIRAPLAVQPRGTVRGQYTECNQNGYVYAYRPRLGDSLWANYVGRYGTHESSYYKGRDFKIQSHGVQVGLDMISTCWAHLGIMFGYERQRSEVVGDRVKADDWYFGFYGSRMFGAGFDLRGMIGYGHQDYDMNRFSTFSGRMFDASYEGDVFEANIEVGRYFYAGPCLTYRPALGVDFFTNAVDGARERQTGGVLYNRQSLSQAFVRIGSDLQYSGRYWNFNGAVFYSYQMTDHGDTIRTRVSQGNFSNRLLGRNLGNSVFTFSAGTSVALNEQKTWSLFAQYYGDVYVDGASPVYHTGQLGVLMKF